MKKFLIMTALLVVGGLSAQAAVASCNAYPTLGGPTGIKGNVCQIGDKIFSGFGANGTLAEIPADWIFAVDIQAPVLTSDIYNVNIGQPSGGGTSLGTGTWGVSYVVEVDKTMSPNHYITNVSVGLNPGGFGAGTANKMVYDYASNNLIGQATAIAPGGPNPIFFSIIPSQKILVLETVTVTVGQLSSFTDAYKQTQLDNVPEPATYGMMGLGLAALGLVARRKKA